MACALRDNRTVDCWGDAADHPSPLRGTYQSISVGGGSVCGIQLNGDLACAHQDTDVQRPTHVTGPFSSVSADSDVCVVNAVRDALCWNYDSAKPKRIVGPFTAVSAGFEHTCALRVDQDIVCWGSNREGQAPKRVPGPFTTLDAGEHATCAIKVNQDLRCWGASNTPGTVRGPFASVSVGGGSTCALRTDGWMICWGDPEWTPMPTKPVPLGTGIVRVRVGDAVDTFLDEGVTPPAAYSTVSPMPVGLRFLPDASVQGTPRKPGSYRIDIHAVNLFGSVTFPMTIAVGPATDFDANGDGLPDLVVGAPGEDVGSVSNAGAVNVFYGGPDGRYDSAGGRRITQEDLSQRSERGDRFGAALSLADVTGDRLVDLIIGAPGEDAGAGQVVVVPGSATGLDVASPTILAQGARGAAGAAESGDAFGSSISVGDGLWVGAPGEDIGGAADAGAATRFPINPLTSRGSVQYRQGVRGIPGTPERGDRFGASLGHGGSVIGVPGEDIGRRVDAGIVVWKLTKSISQRTRGVPGRAERGDRFGSVVAAREVYGDNGQGHNPGKKRFLMAAVGVPGEDLKAGKDAGAALLMGETYGRDLMYAKIKPARGTAEAGDRFGSSVAFLNRPDLEFGWDERVVVGAPGEDVGTLADAGAVRSVPLSMYCEHSCGSDAYPEDEYGAVTIIQGRRHTPGVAASGNQFGSAVSRLPGVDNGILVGAPGQTVAGRADAGVVAVLDPVPTHSHQLDQDMYAPSSHSQSGSRFGTLPNR